MQRHIRFPSLEQVRRPAGLKVHEYDVTFAFRHHGLLSQRPYCCGGEVAVRLDFAKAVADNELC